MAELESDKALDKVREDFEKIYNALTRAHHSERRSTGQAETLAADLAQRDTELIEERKITEEDKQIITQLKKVI